MATKPSQHELACRMAQSLTPGPIAYRPTVATLCLEDEARAAYGERVTARIRSRAVGMFCAAVLEAKT